WDKRTGIGASSIMAARLGDCCEVTTPRISCWGTVVVVAQVYACCFVDQVGFSGAVLAELSCDGRQTISDVVRVYGELRIGLDPVA
ncbi:MAG: hypothetical protein QOD72_1270, partial [Acidimicrobiaceae bacterium]|nr:hypothetical protein [Acidimicrobiaceae bacterium]